MVSCTMKHIWILAWSWPLWPKWSPVLSSNFSENLVRHTPDYSETSHKRTSNDNEASNSFTSKDHNSEVQQEDRSLKKRQLDFEGGGGGVNRFVNGEDDFYDDNYYNEINDVEYWDSAVVGRHNYSR